MTLIKKFSTKQSFNGRFRPDAFAQNHFEILRESLAVRKVHSRNIRRELLFKLIQNKLSNEDAESFQKREIII